MKTFNELVRVAASMPFAEFSELISVESRKGTFRAIQREAREFSFNADPVKQFREMMIADLVMKQASVVIGNNAADLAEQAIVNKAIADVNRRRAVKRAGKARTAPVAPAAKVSAKATKAKADKSVKAKGVAKAKPVAKKPVVQQAPSLPVVIGVAVGSKGNYRDIPLKRKPACILAILQRTGEPMPKGGNEGVQGEPGTLLHELQKIGYSQLHVNESCRTLESLGFITMNRIEGQGATLYRQVTAEGAKVKLKQGEEYVSLATLLTK